QNTYSYTYRRNYLRNPNNLHYFFFFFFNDTATTEIYTTRTLFPYTTLFRSPRPSRSPAFPSRSPRGRGRRRPRRSEEHTSELQSRLVISYAVFCLKKKK